jgi:uroporphyrinogen-III synthase
MKVLITRPRRDAEALAATLAARGIDSLIEPLTAIEFRRDGATVLSPLLAGTQAVLFTSANGARAFAAATTRRDLAILAVGDATAEAARDVGFDTVVSAGGNIEDLTRLAIDSLDPAKGALVHAAGSVVAGDLGGALTASGFTVRRAVLYDAVTSTAFSAPTQSALSRDEIEAALFFSPRNAATFVRLAAPLRVHCARIVAVGLSPAVAKPLSELPWRRIAIAPMPTEAALVATLHRSFETEPSP